MIERPRRLPASRRGFTLIELVVVLAIVAMVTGLVTISIANIRRADLKSAGGMMAAAMRYLYNLAVINNAPYRLVIDLEGGAFWGEELDTEDPCARYLPEVGEELKAPGEGEAEGGGDESERDDGLGAGEAEGRIERPSVLDEIEGPRDTAATYEKPKDNLLTVRKLPKGIVVTGVITSHHKAAQEEGRAAIHFFPGGYAEKAWVWLGEKEGENEAEVLTTLSLEALTGRVTRHTEALDEAKFLEAVD